MCVCLCTAETETAVSVFERHESKLDDKQTTKGAKRRDEARPKEKERLAQLSAHKAAEG